MAPTCTGLVLDILARGSKDSANHHDSANNAALSLLDILARGSKDSANHHDSTNNAALNLPSAVSIDSVINLLSDAGPNHTQPFLLAYTYQYDGPLTEAENVLFTFGDKMPTYPGIISHGTAVYAPESLTQQYIEEFLVRNFSANWYITQDPEAIFTYDNVLRVAAVSYAEEKAEAETRRRKATSLDAVAAFLGGLEKVPMDSLGEDSRECSICRGSYGEPVSMNKCLPEHPVRMPCGHVFGLECITLLLSPKPDGWGYKLCPLCRVQIEVSKIQTPHRNDQHQDSAALNMWGG